MKSMTTSLTKEDFANLNWQSVLADSKEKLCESYSRQFRIRSTLAHSAKDHKSEEAFALLSAICSLHLNSHDHNEPFIPIELVDQLDESCLSALRGLNLGAAEPEFKARIQDLLWTIGGDYQNGLATIESYLQSAKHLEQSHNLDECVKRIERAFSLSLRFRKSNPSLLDNMISEIEKLIIGYKDEKPSESTNPLLRDDPHIVTVGLMRLLQDSKLGDPSKYAKISESLAHNAEKENNFHNAIAYWDINERWHVLQRNSEKVAVASKSAAEVFVKMAEIYAKGKNYHAASFHLQIAIDRLRKLGGMQSRTKQLHKQLLEYQTASVENVNFVPPTINVNKLIQEAKQYVSNKDFKDAILVLTQLISPPRREDLRKIVEEKKDENPAWYWLAARVSDEEGKTIAQRASMLFSSEEDLEQAIEAEMHVRALNFRERAVLNVIEPARQQIINEHNIRVRDFEFIVTNNPFIPPGREWIYARGLHSGLIGDFLISTHLLVPQLEHSIRHLLHLSGEITSSLDTQTGLQEHNRLTHLLSVPAATEIFGEDTIFDLNGLLIQQGFGANLRNNLSHGLIAPIEFYSSIHCYLWWLSLHLCSRSFIAQLI